MSINLVKMCMKNEFVHGTKQLKLSLCVLVFKYMNPAFYFVGF
jgi:hypothetical protein